MMRTWVIAGIALAASAGMALAQDAAAGEQVCKRLCSSPTGAVSRIIPLHLTRTGHNQRSDCEELGHVSPLLQHFWTTVAKMLHTSAGT